MFIELADHLRCPADHPEAYLVLLPAVVERRSVRRGHLGCPVCGRTYELVDGVLDVGGEVTARSGGGESSLTADAMVALAGVQGPGGYLVLVGSAVSAWRSVAQQLAGVGLVGVNPEPWEADQPEISVLRGAVLPLKSGSMRGVVLGEGYGGDASWAVEAARVVLPGLRVVGAGAPPLEGVIDLMASTAGVWVGARPRSRV